MRKHTAIIALAGCLLVCGVPRLGAEIVYSNGWNDLNIRFNPGLFEVGDEIVLAGSARIVNYFRFQYYGLDFSGNEQVRVRFYANDGPPSVSGPLMPGTVLWDSGWYDIGPTERSTLIWNDLSVLVPDSFTWAVKFSGIDPGESAGLDIYSPPIIGSSYLDYWFNDGSTWELRTNTVPMDFAAAIGAIPEPTTLALALLGVAGAFVALSRLRREE